MEKLILLEMYSVAKISPIVCENLHDCGLKHKHTAPPFYL
jgi:hypothetical protein